MNLIPNKFVGFKRLKNKPASDEYRGLEPTATRISLNKKIFNDAKSPPKLRTHGIVLVQL